MLPPWVRGEWGGGRVLFLPNGFVVKPLQADNEVGKRALIGRFQGTFVLERRSQPEFDLGSPGAIRLGDPWPGPTTTGLECALQADGSLVCTWYHPTQWGRDGVSIPLPGAGPVARGGVSNRSARRRQRPCPHHRERSRYHQPARTGWCVGFAICGLCGFRFLG